MRQRYYRAEYDSKRGSAVERGYDANWAKARAQKLRENPLCEKCLEVGKYTVAVDAHHIKKLREHPELKYSRENLMALCRFCHQSHFTSQGL